MYRAEGHVGSLVPCLFPDLLACLVESGFAHAYGKLFATLLTLEDQLLSILVSRLVEYYIIVTFRASYSFHISLLFVVGGGKCVWLLWPLPVYLRQLAPIRILGGTL